MLKVDRGPLAAIAVLHLLLGLLFLHATPVLEASDELDHFGYVVEWVRAGAPPKLSPAAPGLARHEAAQPPLYYALLKSVIPDRLMHDAADYYHQRPDVATGRADLPGPRNMLEPVPRGRVAGTYEAVRLGRLISVLLSLATVVMTWQCALLAGAGTAGRLFATSLVAFNPMFLFIGSSVNNDVLVTLLTTIGLVICLRALQEPPTGAQAFGLGVLLGAAALAKTSGLILAPVVAAVCVVHRRTRGATLRTVAGPVLGFAAVAGWWFVAVYREYGVWILGPLQVQVLGNGRSSWQPFALLAEWEGFFKSFWGVFGAFNIIYPEWIYRLLLALTVSLMAAAGWMLVRQREPRHLLLFAAVATNLAALAWWTSILTGSQGRLMFPSIAAIATLSGLAIETWPVPFRNAAAAITVAGLIGAALYAGLTLIPASYLWPVSA